MVRWQWLTFLACAHQASLCGNNDNDSPSEDRPEYTEDRYITVVTTTEGDVLSSRLEFPSRKIPPMLLLKCTHIVYCQGFGRQPARRSGFSRASIPTRFHQFQAPAPHASRFMLHVSAADGTVQHQRNNPVGQTSS